MAISRRLLNEGEDVVLSTRTHAKALLLPVLVLLVTAGVAGFLTSLTSSDPLLWVIWLVALGVVLVFTVWPFLNWLASTYTVTTRRLITRHGVLTRRGHDIPLSRISDVSSERGVLDRVLGCGTLIVSDASERGQVPLPDVPHVEDVQLQLSELLWGHHSREPRHDDGT